MLTCTKHDMTLQELVGWMSCGDPARAERGSYPKSSAWQAGWLAAISWSHTWRDESASSVNA